MNLAKNYHKGYKLLDDETKIKVAKVWEKWVADRDAKLAASTAEDLMPTLSDAEAKAADHMDDINKKLSMRYMCRFLDCGSYRSSQSWAS